MILKKILESKRGVVEQQKKITPLHSLKASLKELPPAFPLDRALKRPGEVTIIAEVKRASPTRGILRLDFHPVKIAQEYQQNGAAAISVLTEENYFQGHPSFLVFMRNIIKLPLLRKDFIIDPYQLYESRVLGADAVLLIAAALPGEQLAEYRELAAEMGLSSLVEVHTEGELQRALDAGAAIIGINNRDLNTFETDINRTISLVASLKGHDVAIVSESGIKSRSDILKLKDHGVHAALVGEALIRGVSPGEELQLLTGLKSGPVERGRAL